MDTTAILQKVSQGRTDLIFDLIASDDFPTLLNEGPVKLLQWLIYYNDLTAIKAVLRSGGDLGSINLDLELNTAAFFGHWKICEFLIKMGADVNAKTLPTHESPLHSALCKSGRPYYIYTLKILVEHGADMNAKTKPGVETAAFMRDVRTKGETPLHRAAAYADANMIGYLLDKGADKEARDAYGNAPLSWASEHLRPGKILALLAFGPHRINKLHETKSTSDHGNNWGNSLDWNLFGDYAPLGDCF